MRRVALRVWLQAQQQAHPVLRASQQRLRALRGAYVGQRTFLMGNGPSLNHTPLDLLASEYVWGFNRCHLLFERIPWRPAFYVAIDTVVVPDIAADIRGMLATLPDTTFFFPASFYLQGTLPDHPAIIWYSELLPHPDEGAPGYFSFDATRFVRAAHTVTIAAMQLAVHLGFNPLYLIGCDTAYTIPADTSARGTLHDQSTGERIEGFELQSHRDNDPNHFDPRYFGAGRRWHHPNVNGMQYGYRMAHGMCAANGVQVYNATVGGALDVFPRVSIERVLHAAHTGV